MATNKVQDGKVLTIAKASVDSGDVVVVGAITGVALTDTDANGKIELAREGVYSLTVTGNNGTDDATVAIGDKIYASAAGALSLDAGGTYFGIALEAIGTAGAAAEIDVLLV
jgi:predicted RecA/RadA family phage recombinase